jgi:hypothetical protein
LRGFGHPAAGCVTAKRLYGLLKWDWPALAHLHAFLTRVQVKKQHFFHALFGLAGDFQLRKWPEMAGFAAFAVI